MREAHDNYLTKTVAKKSDYKVIEFNTTLNNIDFNSTNYSQIMGCEMGIIFVPAYANIFMAQFEKQHIYPYIKNKSILYLRYIDDIFTIRTETNQELLTFLEKLNRKHKTIKFERNILRSNISFSDTLIHKDKNNTLQTTRYQKPTDQQSYFHAHLDHSESLMISIPYSQALKIKTIFSTLTEHIKNTVLY